MVLSVQHHLARPAPWNPKALFKNLRACLVLLAPTRARAKVSAQILKWVWDYPFPLRGNSLTASYISWWSLGPHHSAMALVDVQSRI